MKTKASPQVHIDLVCGMRVTSFQKNFVVTYERRNYYFCSEFCRDIFKMKPEMFLSSKLLKPKGR